MEEDERYPCITRLLDKIEEKVTVSNVEETPLGEIKGLSVLLGKNKVTLDNPAGKDYRLRVQTENEMVILDLATTKDHFKNYTPKLASIYDKMNKILISQKPLYKANEGAKKILEELFESDSSDFQ